MRTKQPIAGPKKLVNEIQLARIRLARAESKWELADEQAREARRRRKEARQAARQAKKLARQAKKEFAAAKEALIEMEEKFAAAVERAVHRRKLARARLAKKAAAARTAAKAATAAGRSRPAAPVPFQLPKFPELGMAGPKTVKKTKPAARPRLPARVKSVTATAAPAASGEKPPITPRDLVIAPPGPPEVLPSRPAAAQLPAPSIPPTGTGHEHP
jgi:hypothetical protein